MSTKDTATISTNEYLELKKNDKTLNDILDGKTPLVNVRGVVETYWSPVPDDCRGLCIKEGLDIERIENGVIRNLLNGQIKQDKAILRLRNENKRTTFIASLFALGLLLLATYVVAEYFISLYQLQ